MKNIHILPTDKPSRLILQTNNELRLSVFSFKGAIASGITQNIYITSDEEIKEGDWYLDTFNNQRIKANQFSDHKHYGNACKKIILTTDQDLINEGVQSIDDEFLEWFVKNPNREKVDVESKCCGAFYGCDKCKNKDYKIIIPKEEPKQVGQVTEKGIIDTIGNCPNCGVEFHIHKDITEPKQETLEEASLLSRPIHLIWDEDERYDCNEEFREEFKKGVKWQQERSYSELVDLLERLTPIYREDSDLHQKYDRQRLEFIEKFKKK